MIGVIEKENSLNKSEIEFVKDTSLNFRATSTPEDNRHYFKQTIEDYSKLSNFLEKSKNEFLKFGFGENKKLEVGEVWINKVTTDTNKKDDRHIDFNQLTSVTFINDDFEEET